MYFYAALENASSHAHLPYTDYHLFSLTVRLQFEFSDGRAGAAQFYYHLCR